MTDYIVIRRAPGMPREQMPDGLDGRWYDRTEIPVGVTNPTPPTDGMTRSTATATPTDRFEVREDGAVAQVWEVRW